MRSVARPGRLGVIALASLVASRVAAALAVQRILRGRPGPRDLRRHPRHGVAGRAVTRRPAFTLAGLVAASRLAADPLERPPRRPAVVTVGAPRRFAPDEQASVTVGRRVADAMTVALHRVRDPLDVASGPLVRPGVSFVGTPIGEAMERLLDGTGPLPRPAAGVDLLRLFHLPASTQVSEGAPPPEERLDLGRLPAGVYLARVTAGGWAATSVVSVGALALLARRGERGDRVFVSDSEGRTQAGVSVWRVADDRRAHATTDGDGSAGTGRVEYLSY